MMKFKLKYYYLATGMEGIADEFPEKVIYANSEDEAFYLYALSNGNNYGSFEDFMKRSRISREWGTSCVRLVENPKKVYHITRQQWGEITEACEYLNRKNPDPTSIFVQFLDAGFLETLEVTKKLLTIPFDKE